MRNAAQGREEPAGARRSPARPRIVDGVVAFACYALVTLLALVPGGIHEPDADSSSPAVSGLLFRFFPALLVEGPYGPMAAVDQWAIALAVFVLVPGSVGWAVLHRRSSPQWLLGIGAVLLPLISNIVPTAIALYTLAARSADRRRLTAWTSVSLVAFAAGLWGAFPGWSMLTLLLVGFVTPLSLGLWASTRSQLVESLRDRAQRLEREQHLMAERAITAERTRIAREMHDVVAHRVSLIVLHAGGLELSTRDPELAQTAEHISRIGREALSELREVLGVLHDTSGSEPPTAPPPVLADVEQLVEHWQTAGASVDYRRDGEPRELSEHLERTAYRVVQEALTNAGKHAAGALVQVRVQYRRTDVAITVTNELVAGANPSPESGYGLAGLRERVALAGGRLVVGPLSESAWEVRATLPDSRREAPDGTQCGARTAVEEAPSDQGPARR